METAIVISDVPTSPATEPRPKPHRLGRAHREFIAHYVATNGIDPEASSKAAGFRAEGLGYKLAAKLSQEIATARDKRFAERHMHLPEALAILADLAREGGPDTDKKTKLAAVRTVLEVGGALLKGPMPEAERASLTRTMDELVSSLRSAPVDGKGRKRARVAVTLSAQAETGGDEPDR